MGVPRFFRWLSERYPKINSVITDLTLMPVFDNLYLDMNGIIHACSHPSDGATTALPERDVLLSIFAYVDRIVGQIVRPRRLLFLAIDGVAPRAKLNQQRSRRFGAAKEAQAAKAEAAACGEMVGDAKLFDRNCITPGTAFMALIGEKLRSYIRQKMARDPAWSRLTVVYSGADVPGEGEHKIVQYIRAHRDVTAVRPTRHCMYGNDADLIMLALATHEPYFTLLREVIDFGANKREHAAPVNARSTVLRQSRSSDFQLLHLSVLREYIQLEFCCSPPESYACHVNTQVGVGPHARKGQALPRDHLADLWKQGVSGRAFDIERLIDDFVFLTFFVGNDFLPHSPSLDIGEHAFNRIFDAYKRHLAVWPPGGYLTDAGSIADACRLQRFVSELGAMEPAILADRKREVERERRRHKKTRHASAPGDEEKTDSAVVPPGVADTDREKYYLRTLGISCVMDQRFKTTGSSSGQKNDPSNSSALISNYQAALDLSTGKAYYYNASTQATAWVRPTEGLVERRVRRTVNRNSHTVVERLSAAFVEGLAWCLAYYIKGCVDWRWFFPCHYCPMLTDVVDLTGALSGVRFAVGAPLQPLEQLMSCLPPASADLLPRPHRSLMLEGTSPLAEFYPSNFDVDMDGKRNPWEGVNLLPFIEVDRLLDVVEAICEDSMLAADERARAGFGQSIVFTANTACRSESIGFTAMAPAGDTQEPMPEDVISRADVSECNEHPDMTEPWLACGPPFQAVLPAGSSQASPGFPSLHTIPIISAELKALKLNCFGSPSRYETLCLKLPSLARAPIAQPDAEAASVAAALLGNSLFVNWPMTHEARLVAVTGGGRCYLGDGDSSEVEIRSLDSRAASNFDAACVDMATRARTGTGGPGDGGIDIGTVDVILTVRLLQGLVRDATSGALAKVHGREVIDVPLQLVLSAPPRTHVEDPRFLETIPELASSRFMIGSRVLLRSGPRRGCVGIVRQCDDEKNRVTVDVPVGDIEPQFGLAIAAALADKFASAALAAGQLDLRKDVLAACCGSILTRNSHDGLAYDLGLRLYIDGGAYVALGYCRAERLVSETRADDWAQAGDALTGSGTPRFVRRGLNFEYSAKAIRLVASYLKRFPAVFDAVADVLAHASADAANIDGACSYTPVVFDSAAQIFGHDEAELRLLEVCKWLAALPTGTTARVPISTVAMSPGAVAAVQRAATKRTAISLRADAMRETVTVPVVDIRAEQEAADVASCARIIDLDTNRAPPRLGERVVACNVGQTGAPFGQRGTIIATHAHSGSVDVVFDTPFVGGTSLQGACDNFRGLLCPWTSLLSIRDPAPDRSIKSASALTPCKVSIPPATARLQSRLKDNRLAKGPDTSSGFGFAPRRGAGRRAAQNMHQRQLPVPVSTPAMPIATTRGAEASIQASMHLVGPKPPLAVHGLADPDQETSFRPCLDSASEQSSADTNPPLVFQAPRSPPTNGQRPPATVATPARQQLSTEASLLHTWSASADDRLAVLDWKLSQKPPAGLSYGYHPAASLVACTKTASNEAADLNKQASVLTTARRIPRTAHSAVAPGRMLPTSLLGKAPMAIFGRQSGARNKEVD